MKTFSAAVVLLLLCSSVSPSQALTISAGSTATDEIVTPIKAAFEKATGIKLVSLKFPGKIGVAKLANNEVEAVITDSSLESIMAAIEKGAILFPDPSRLKAVPIMQSRSVVIVHKDNPVSALSKEQLTSIFSGKVTDWTGVGGNSAAILVAISDNNKGTLADFSSKIMGKESLLKETANVANDQDVKDFVAGTPEAIGVLPSVTMVDASVKMPSTPDFSKTVSLFSIGAPAGDVKKLLDYLNGPGRKLITK